MAAKPERYQYPSHLSAYAPRNSICPRCNAKTKTGRYDALPFTIDPWRLNPRGELTALLLRLRTWHIVDEHVYRRKAHAIRSEPQPRLGFVYREHRCGTPKPTADQLWLPRLPVDDCPF